MLLYVIGGSCATFCVIEAVNHNWRNAITDLILCWTAFGIAIHFEDKKK